MNSRINTILALIAAIIGGVLVFSPPLSAADPTPIACPNGQTVFLEGQSSPREALLIYMRGRAVGGGLAGPDGRYKLPLRPQERPGIYPIEVRVRSTGAAVATFNCFVDIPLENITTPTEPLALTAAPTTAPGAPTPIRTAQPTLTAAPTTAATTARTGTTTTARATVATTTTITTTVTATTSATVTSTATVTTTTVTATPVLSGAVKIDGIELKDPTFPDLTDESVQIFNPTDEAITITGWRLLNASNTAIEAYIFPVYILEGDVTISVFSSTDDDDLVGGNFYWDQPGTVWANGDRAELRDAQGRLISFYIVGSD